MNRQGDAPKPFDEPADSGGFLSRWSRRKELVRQGETPAEPVRLPVLPATPAAPVAPVALAAALEAAAAVPAPASQAAPPAVPVSAPVPAPTMADVQALVHESDFSRFVAPGVGSDVKNAALKKLFSNPHFNVMDGLDTYIDDYSQPDPLPAGMLRQMAQAKFLGLFQDETEPEADSAAAATIAADPADPADLADPAAPGQPAALAAGLTPNALPPQAPRHEDADLRLQPHDATGPTSPGACAEPDPGCQR